MPKNIKCGQTREWGQHRRPQLVQACQETKRARAPPGATAMRPPTIASATMSSLLCLRKSINALRSRYCGRRTCKSLSWQPCSTCGPSLIAQFVPCCGLASSASGVLTSSSTFVIPLIEHRPGQATWSADSAGPHRARLLARPHHPVSATLRDLFAPVAEADQPPLPPSPHPATSPTSSSKSRPTSSSN